MAAGEAVVGVMGPRYNRGNVRNMSCSADVCGLVGVGVAIDVSLGAAGGVGYDGCCIKGGWKNIYS